MYVYACVCVCIGNGDKDNWSVCMTNHRTKTLISLEKETCLSSFLTNSMGEKNQSSREVHCF